MVHGTDSRYIHLMMTELECHFKLSNHALSTKDHLSESSRLVNKKQNKFFVISFMPQYYPNTRSYWVDFDVPNTDSG